MRWYVALAVAILVALGGASTQSDSPRGTQRSDTLKGLAGDDVLNGGGDADVLRGGAGDDLLQGGLGPARLFGGAGDDVLDEGGGDDELHGDDGADQLFGSSGVAGIRWTVSASFVVFCPECWQWEFGAGKLRKARRVAGLPVQQGCRHEVVDSYIQPSSFIAHGAFHTLHIRATLSSPFMVNT